MNVTIEFLQSFADAFNAHDLEAIMNHMTKDCVFEASAGPDVNGKKFTGQAAVRKAFADVFASFPEQSGPIPNTLFQARPVFRNGHFPARGRMAKGWK